MQMKKMLLAVVLILNVSIPAVADVAVTDVVAKQRYPWNGLVDITCNVTGIEGETNGLKFAVAAVMPETGNARNVSHFWVVQGGTNSVDREVHTNGNYRLLWDARADLGIVRYTNMVVRISFDAHEKVQLWEDGPYWATTNIGAENPEDYGYYFWWGDTVGYTRKGGTWTSGYYYSGVTWVSSTGEEMASSPFNSSSSPTYNKSVSTLQSEGWVVSENGTYVLAPEHDAAQVQWGGGWRMPTYQELYDLCYNKCDWTWTTQNGVNGYVVRGRGDYASNSIFLPCAGNGNGTSLNNSGSNGNYWSSVPNSDNNNARNLNFNSGNHNMNNNNRNNGFSVRPVQEFAADPGDAVPHRALLADLIEAYHDARRHKRSRPYQTRFEMNQERELVDLRDELLERRYTARPCSCFIIHDPKMREVFAAEFRDRVVHHLFYNYTHELFERTFIADSYSCIEGRGTHYGVERLKHHLLSCSQNWTKPCYVLKLDVKGYFMSINRARLLARCREILGSVSGRDGRDWPLIDYLLESICMLDPVANCRIIGNRDEWKLLPKEKSLFNSKPGCGLPIGNLSSQLFSNIYLGVFDDFMKRELKCRHYGRYVDDAYVVASSKEELWSIVPKAMEFLRDELELELNEAKVRVIDARRGVEFLGAYVKPYRTYPANRSLRRMRGRLKSLDWSEGPDKVQARVNSMLGVLSHYDCWHRRKVLAWEAHLREHGRVTDDCLRFEPDRLAQCGFDLQKRGAE